MRARAFTLLCAVGALVVAVPSASVGATASPAVKLTFNTPSGALRSTQTAFQNSGTANVAVSVVSENSGRVRSVESMPGHGDAIGFPAFDDSSTPRRAVVEMTNATSTDQLAPKRHSFLWGADFKIDATSASRAKGSNDNGDNLLQRGLYTGTQYKLQLDEHRADCRLRGSTGVPGSVSVEIPVTVSPAYWYNATCTRSGNTLTTKLMRYDADGNVTKTWTESGTSSGGFGTVTYPETSIPLTVGGKINAKGNLAHPSSDQFNGLVDHVVYRLLS